LVDQARSGPHEIERHTVPDCCALVIVDEAHVQGVRLNHTIFPREERPARVCDCMAL
jgi:hypothetical protein